MPAVSCAVCGVVMKSKEDKAYRLVINVTIANDDDQILRELKPLTSINIIYHYQCQV